MLNETSVTTSVEVMPAGDPVNGALKEADGAAVSLGPVVFLGKAPAIDSKTFFVSSADGTGALRCQFTGTMPNLALGQRIAVSGNMRAIGGQRYLECTGFTAGTTGGQVSARTITNRTLGGARLNSATGSITGGHGAYNLGCLVKAFGKVTSVGTDFYYISDGSLTNDNDGQTALKVKCGTYPKPAVGAYVSAIGFSCTEDDAGTIRRMLVQRTGAEMTTHKAP
jgi:hypothetical protein